MTVFIQLKEIFRDALSLGDRANDLTLSTQLLGGLPEFDSMAVLAVLNAVEEHFGITIGDDEVSAEVFQSLGTLTKFIEQKLLALHNSSN